MFTEKFSSKFSFTFFYSLILMDILLINTKCATNNQNQFSQLFALFDSFNKNIHKGINKLQEHSFCHYHERDANLLQIPKSKFLIFLFFFFFNALL